MEHSEEHNLDHYLETYLILKNKLPPSFKIYTYDKSDLFVYYHNLYEFIYNDLKNNWNDFGINPCYFYFIEEGLHEGKQVKAYAENGKDFNVIGINYRIFESLKLFIDSYFRKLDDNNSKVVNIEQFIDLSANDLVYQTSIQFIYFHELGHIIQNSNVPCLISEENKVNISRLNIIKSHVMETDSDIFSANLVADHIIGFWNRQDQSECFVETLEDIVSLCLVGIFLTFDYLSNGIRPFYLLETTHPHEVCRITLISGIINGKINMIKSVEVDRDKVTRNFCRILLEFKKDTPINKYFGALSQFGDEMYLYSKFIRDEGHKYPNLTSFKMEKRR